MTSATGQDEAAVALPSPPFVSVVGIPNFRDLGGYPVSHSSSTHSIRRGTIYRCGDPSRVTPDGVKTMQALAITHMYDLRSNTEIERSKAAGRGGVVEWEGCERVFVPVFADKDYSPEGIAMRFKEYASGSAEVTSPPPARSAEEQWLRTFQSQGFTRAYTEILENAPEAYRRILLHVAYEPSKPFTLHCTAGKDRTGVLCALILSLCGVDDHIVAYEYSLTEIGLLELRDVIVAHLMANPALKDNIDGAMNMISAKAENMLATLAMIREKFGGPEGYVTEKCRLTADEVQRIRDNLIVATPPIHQVPSTYD